MATIFVSSVDGSNADSGADWTNAKQTVAGALAIAADGDVIKVDSAHNFTATAAITWTPPAGRVAVISVNRAGSDAWLAGATESIGASSNIFAVTGAAGSNMYVYGMTLNGGTNNSGSCLILFLNIAGVVSFLEFASCTIDLKAPNASAYIQTGLSASATGRSLVVKLTNTTITISGSRAGTAINLAEGSTLFTGCTISATGGTKPASLFSATNLADTAVVEIADSDLVGYTGAAYFSVAQISTARITGRNLKLHATPTITTGTWAGGDGFIQLRNVDSGNTLTTFSYRNAYGTLTDNESIYAASGASFNNAGVSWQIVTTAACNESFPFITPWISLWNTVTTGQTATIETISDTATPLTDRDIWEEYSYPSSASFPIGTTATDRNVNPFTGSAVNQTSSATTWTGTGGFTNPDKRTLDVPFTAAAVGLVAGRVSVGKASTTVYIDPKLRVA